MSFRSSKSMLWGSGVMGGSKNLCMITDCPFCKRAKTHTQQQVSLVKKQNARMNLASVSGFSSSMGCESAFLSTASHPSSYQLNQLLGLTSVAPLYTQCKEGFEPWPAPLSFAESVEEKCKELYEDVSVLEAYSDNIDAFQAFLEELIQKEEVQISSMHQNVQLQVFREKFEQEQQVLQQKHEEQKQGLVRQLTRHRSQLEQLQNEGMRLTRDRQQKEADKIAKQLDRENLRIQKQLRKEQLAVEKQQRLQELQAQKQQTKEARVAKKTELVSAAEQYEKALNQQITEYMQDLLELDEAVGFLTAQIDVQNSHATAAESLSKHVQEMLWSSQEENIDLESDLSCTNIEASTQENRCIQLNEQLLTLQQESEKERTELTDYRDQVQKRFAFLEDRRQQYKQLKAQKREIGRINSIWEPEKHVIESDGKIQPPMPPPMPPLMRSRSLKVEQANPQQSEEESSKAKVVRRAVSMVAARKEGFENKKVQEKKSSIDAEAITISEEAAAASEDSFEEEVVLPSTVQVNAKKEEFEKQQKEQLKPIKSAIKRDTSQLRVSSIKDNFERKISIKLDDADVPQVKSIMKDFERSNTVSKNAVKARRVHFENVYNKESKEISVQRTMSSSVLMKFASADVQEQEKRSPARRNSTRPNLRMDSDRWNDLIKLWQTDQK
eukprot:TRINITY_DN8746_c0_g2_i1.p1 TRINITY_DN8746_c0_g2~~TRINITY_DN8746_c0_g2_i1.p1  ORF type:complete len:712 (+),score=146.92 TRINITY_DN8746_c0_g2_i1:133-2136(+)